MEELYLFSQSIAKIYNYFPRVWKNIFIFTEYCKNIYLLKQYMEELNLFSQIMEKIYSFSQSIAKNVFIFSIFRVFQKYISIILLYTFILLVINIKS